MFPQKYKEKLKVLGKIVRLVYTTVPLHTALRDLLFVATTAMEMYTISVGGQFIDATARFLSETEVFTIQGFFTSDSFFYLALGLILWMLTNAAGKTRNYLKERIDQHVLFEMQGQLLHKISKSNLEDVENKSFRDLLAFVPGYSYNNILYTYDAYSELVRQLIRTVTATVILVETLGISAIVLTLIPISETYMGHFNRKKVRKFDDSEVERWKKIDYIQYTATRIPFFPELRVDGTFIQLMRSYAKECMQYIKGYLERQKHYYIDTALFAVTGRVMMTAYVVYILAVSVAKRLTIGHFTAMYNYAVAAYESAFAFLNSIFQISNYIEYAKKYFEYVEYKGFGDREHGTRRLKKGTPSLEFQNLDFQYPDDTKKVLENINLKIEPGEKVAIVGSDGSGKSSLIRIFCGLYKIAAGDYVVGGYSIRELDRGQLKKKISAVFQDYVNYNFSVKRNITLAGEKDKIDEKLYKKVLKISGVSKFLKDERISDKQVLGKYFARGREVSPGHWQRLAIARMLYRNRSIFIMDEAFLYIDGVSRKQLMKDIMSFVGPDRTLIYITQDRNNIKKFSRTFTLANGQISEDKKKLKSRKA
jgi:ATP-binding cassette subfamily B protein